MAAKTTKPPQKGCTDRWENEGGPARQDEAPSADGKLPDMKKLGITPVQLTVYDCAGYRYSNLRDAIAASDRTAYRRAAVYFYVESRGSTRMLVIDPDDLDSALARDAAAGSGHVAVDRNIARPS